MKILVLNGPNLNLLGQREPGVYGTQTLEEVNCAIRDYVQEHYAAGFDVGNDGTAARNCEANGATAPIKLTEPIELDFFQSNHEGQLIDAIQNSPNSYAGILYNPAAHTHYSIALRDAIAAVPTPVVEVHLSDIAQREEFRRASLMTDVCIACFMGKGTQSYLQALDALVVHLAAERSEPEPEFVPIPAIREPVAVRGPESGRELESKPELKHKAGAQ